MENGVAGESLGAQAVPTAEAQQELDRLLADPAFRTPERNKNFLRFAANEYFEGRAEAVKAYTVAVDVFGRPSTFDPTLDPIVRIEATRLRTALSQYYDSKPDGARVRIDLPKGRYVPTFSAICSEPTNATTLLDRIRKLGPAGGTEPAAEKGISQRRLLAVVTFTALVTCAGAIGFGLSHAGMWTTATWRDKPIVTVDMKLPDGASGTKAQSVRDGIMVALSQFQAFRLAAAAEDRPVVYTSSIDNTVKPSGHPYRVVLKYAEEAGRPFVWWRVTDDANGEVLRSGVVNADRLPSDMTVEQALAAKVAVRLAGRRGAINDVEMNRELTAPSLGNGCVLRALAAIQNHDAAQMDVAVGCLKTTLAAAATSSDANAVQAMLIAAEDPTEALAFANTAVQLAPSSDRAQLAQSIALFEAGRLDAAIAAGYRALALNPANSAVMAKLALMLALSGRSPEGAALAMRSEALDTDESPDAAIAVALDAYRAGRYDDALLKVAQLTDTDDGMAAVLLTATLGQLGRGAEAREAFKLSGGEAARFEPAIATMRKRQYAPDLIGALEAGLSKAGALPQ